MIIGYSTSTDGEPGAIWMAAGRPSSTVFLKSIRFCFPPRRKEGREDLIRFFLALFPPSRLKREFEDHHRDFNNTLPAPTGSFLLGRKIDFLEIWEKKGEHEWYEWYE